MQRKIKFMGKRHFQNNFIVYFTLFIFLIVGIVIGSVLVNRLDGSEGYSIVKYFSPLIDYIDYGDQLSLDLFKASLISNVKFTIVIWLSGFIFIGMIIIPLMMALKGISIGMTVGYLIKEFGIKGFTFALSGLLPHYLILLPGILAICAIGLSNAKANSNLQGNSLKKINQINLVEYSLLFLLFFSIIIMGSLVEAFTIPYFIKLTRLKL